MTNSVSSPIVSERDDAPPHRNSVSGIKRTVTTSDGVSLSVREYGPRDAAHTVVLLHGFCLNKDSWTIQIGTCFINTATASGSSATTTAATATPRPHRCTPTTSTNSPPTSPTCS